jgi:hypothetical protein
MWGMADPELFAYRFANAAPSIALSAHFLRPGQKMTAREGFVECEAREIARKSQRYV